jgi:predicted nucleic acid-binding Zn ribbon protein
VSRNTNNACVGLLDLGGSMSSSENSNVTAVHNNGASSRPTKFCHACGAQIDLEAVVCPKCGVSQKGKSGVGSKSRVTAALLAFFLGGLGIHKFYLGQGGMGVLYLLFCWTFIPALIAFIEFIIYLTMTDEAFAEKFG